MPPRYRSMPGIVAFSFCGIAALLSGRAFANAQLIVSGISEPVAAASTMAAPPPVGIPFEDANVTQDAGPAPTLYTVKLTQGRANLQGPFMSWAKLAPTGWAERSRRDAILLVHDTSGGQLTGTTTRYDLRACAPYKLAASSNQGENVSLTLFALSCKGVTGPTPVDH